MSNRKSIIFLIVWFAWASGQALDSIARYSVKSDYYVYSSHGIAFVFFIFIFVIFILNIATTYYLFKPNYIGCLTALGALLVGAVQDISSLFLALNDITGVREAYAIGREIRGLSVREKALDMIFTPAGLYSNVGIMLFLYLIVAFFIVKNKFYIYGSIDKLIEIEGLENGAANNISRLLELSHDSDEEIRYRALEAFGNFYPTEIIISRVRDGLDDKNDLVRRECIELLGDWQDIGSIEKFHSALSDKSSIVRSGAITSLGQSSTNQSTREVTIKILKERFEDMASGEKASAAIALYALGESDYLDKLLSLFGDEDYHTRCAVANLICSFINKEDITRVVAKMKQVLLKEDTVAASSSLINAVETLKSN